MNKNIYRVKLFLTADTAEQLVKKQVENNLLHLKEFEYTDINKVGNKWYAWYGLDIKTLTQKKDESIS
jgi:adenosine deaminase